MDTSIITRLAKIMGRQNIKSLEISEGDFKVKLERDTNALPVQSGDYGSQYVPQVVQVPQVIQAAKAGIEEERETISVDLDKSFAVRSPLVGVFYVAPSPDAAPYVAPGAKVKKGDVLCIVEAMKQMNEITADIDGEIVDICLKNGDIVEYDQVMFKIQ